MEECERLLILSREDVQKIVQGIDANALTQMMGKALHQLSNHQLSNGAGTPSEVQSPHRTSIQSEQSTFLFMPSRKGKGQTVCKIVGIPTQSSGAGLPATTSVFDEKTGRTKAIVNAQSLTAIRTAAASALCTKAFASESAENLVIYGTGAQAIWHATLILQIRPSITKCIFVSRSPVSPPASGSSQAIDTLAVGFPGVDFRLINSSREREGGELEKVVRGAQIICTCTPSTSPLFPSSWLSPGTHINAIGSYKHSMIELDPAIFSPSSFTSRTTATTTTQNCIIVDSLQACLQESGEIYRAKERFWKGREGEMDGSLIELGSLVEGESGEVDLGKVGLLKGGGGEGGGYGCTVYKSVGVGGMDVAITCWVVGQALEKGLGKWVDFF